MRCASIRLKLFTGLLLVLISESATLLIITNSKRKYYKIIHCFMSLKLWDFLDSTFVYSARLSWRVEWFLTSTERTEQGSLLLYRCGHVLQIFWSDIIPPSTIEHTYSTVQYSAVQFRFIFNWKLLICTRTKEDQPDPKPNSDQNQEEEKSYIKSIMDTYIRPLICQNKINP